MHPSSIRQELLRAIAALPDDWLVDVLQMIHQLRTEHMQASNPPSPPLPTILERMGGMPRFLIHNGQLSDRDHRRTVIRDRIWQRHHRTP
jgi:hypothetical protein